MLFLETSQLKINLSLRVLRRREDGYHDIHSLFWRIPSPEVLQIALGERNDACVVVGDEIPGENIVLRACRALRAKGLLDGVPPLDMRLYKQIPMGSGVGAGSGNAAALLRWAARSVGSDCLGGGVAATLGADVAFLAAGHALALADGIGDRLEPVPGHLDLVPALFFPRWSCNTAEAYRALDELRVGETAVACPQRARAESLEILRALTRGERVGLLPNDFFACLMSRHVCYNNLYDVVERMGALAWGLCGSGSACFALFRRGDVSSAISCVFADLAQAQASRFGWLGRTLILE